MGARSVQNTESSTKKPSFVGKKIYGPNFSYKSVSVKSTKRSLYYSPFTTSPDSLPLSIYLSPLSFLPLYYTHTLCLSLSLSHTHTHSLSFSSLILSLSLYLSLSISISVSISLSILLIHSISLSYTLLSPLLFSLSLSPSVYLSLSPSYTLYLSHHIDVINNFSVSSKKSPR